MVWVTFYDIRRYGGLQIFLRAVLGGDVARAVERRRAGRASISTASAVTASRICLGTPTHWRRALMSPAIGKISPRYVRLSGEIADQAILDSLRNAFPQAVVSHAYASTEAGVAFEVRDGLAGFPGGIRRTGPRRRRDEGAGRLAAHPLAARRVRAISAPARRSSDEDGFVDTGDMVELRGDRYMFAGRRGGIINIGG